MSEHRLSYENGVEVGYARGLDAAREAVAGLELWSLDKARALAAIDALRGEL